jgi:hypothetical protein
MGNCSICHQQIWLEIPSGKRLEMDKRTEHFCKNNKRQPNETLKMVQQLPQTTREKRIDDLALMKIASFDRIAAAIEKNNGQNVADALYAVATTLSLKRSLERFAKFPIATSFDDKSSSPQPRLLLVSVDVAEGAAVTFDSYERKTVLEDPNMESILFETEKKWHINTL